MSLVLLSACSDSESEHLRSALMAAGFDVTPHVLGAAPAVDLTPFSAAIVMIGDRPEAALAQTRRWRLELGDRLLSVIWLLPECSEHLAIQGLEAGADYCHPRTIGLSLLLAQLRSCERMHAAANRLHSRADESLLIGEQLRKARSQLSRATDLSRRLRCGLLPDALPAVGSIRFTAYYRPSRANGSEFYDVRRLDESHVGMMLGGVPGGSAYGSLLAVLVHQTARWKEMNGLCYRLTQPEDVLLDVNRELLGLGLEDPPLAALAIGQVNARDGSFTLARAGLPAPIVIPAVGEPTSFPVSGPYLGMADTVYTPLRGSLSPGDKLLLTGECARREQFLSAATRHRHLCGQDFTETLAADLLPISEGDLTLLTIERVGS